MKTKVIFVIVAFFLILVVATAGCVDNVESIEDEYIFIDPDNGVMYGAYWLSGPKIGLYHLVNEDGTPKVLKDPAMYFVDKNPYTNYIANKYSETVMNTKCYVDEETGVLYLKLVKHKFLVELTDVIVMLNPDGTPKTFEASNNQYYDISKLQEEKNANVFSDKDTGVVYLRLGNTILPMVDQYGNYKTVKT